MKYPLRSLHFSVHKLRSELRHTFAHGATLHRLLNVQGQDLPKNFQGGSLGFSANDHRKLVSFPIENALWIFPVRYVNICKRLAEAIDPIKSHSPSIFLWFSKRFSKRFSRMTSESSKSVTAMAVERARVRPAEGLPPIPPRPERPGQSTKIFYRP